MRWLIMSLLGPLEHVEVLDPEFNGRIRIRYESDIAELAALGFDYLCGDGETLSFFRLPLLLPALLLFSRLRRRIPMTRDGTRLVCGFPLLVSADRTTYGICAGPGFQLLTAFTDGTVLVTENCADPHHRGPKVVKNSRPGAIRDVWAAHQRRLETLTAGGRQVRPDANYETYVEAAFTEWAPW